jgi:outer membrane receptor protein involved in Fe transport
LSLFWKTPIREGIQLQLRLEAFNAFNRTHFANPGTTLGTAQFGQISNVTQTANPGRQIQISARIQF